MRSLDEDAIALTCVLADPCDGGGVVRYDIGVSGLGEHPAERRVHDRDPVERACGDPAHVPVRVVRRVSQLAHVPENR